MSPRAYSESSGRDARAASPGAGTCSARDAVDSPRPGVTNFAHIDLVVEDLDETVRFLALLGFHCDDPTVYSGEWIDRIIDLENATVEVIMASPPDGSDMFE